MTEVMPVGDSRELVTDRTTPLYETLRTALITGIAVVVPVLITIYVLTVAVGILTQVLGPFVQVFEQLGVPGFGSQLLVELLAVIVLLGVTVLIGLLATFQRGQRAISYFDLLVERVPGLGSVYKSFRKMSDVLIESDSENFQSVVLVEFPHNETYTLGFKTTDSPEEITAATAEESLVTLFLPLAPNPVMGGHLAHVPADRVHEVDMTVEEGMRTVVTTGVGVGESEATSLDRSEMAQLSQSGGYSQQSDGDGS